MKSEKLSPIFVVGASRSGTTMFRLMLNSHSKIHIPPEAWFFGELLTSLPAYGELSPAQVQVAREIIRSNVRWPDWNCSDERLDAALAFECQPRLAELINRVFRECTAAGSECVWGEKSPRHSHIILQMRAVFPDAKFIHLIRDGSDSCISIFQRGWYDRSFRRICEHWVTTVRAAQRGADFGAGHYMEVRYEELINSTDSVLRKVCLFLGLPFEEGMIDFTARIESDIVAGESGLHSNLLAGVQKELVGKGRDAMTDWQKVVYRILCGSLSRELGYEEPTLRFCGRLILPLGRGVLYFQRLIHALLHGVCSMKG